MLKNITMASLTVCAILVTAPSALANDPLYDCDFSSVRQDAVTGQTFEGVASGYVVHLVDTGATIRCYIRVNGAEQTTTPTSAGATTGRLTYSAGNTDVVTFHAEVCSSSHGCVTSDYETRRAQTPPQEINDLTHINVEIVSERSGETDRCNGAIDLECDDRGDWCNVWAALVCVIG